MDIHSLPIVLDEDQNAPLDLRTTISSFDTSIPLTSSSDETSLKQIDPLPLMSGSTEQTTDRVNSPLFDKTDSPLDLSRSTSPLSAHCSNTIKSANVMINVQLHVLSLAVLFKALELGPLYTLLWKVIYIPFLLII